jgi:general stress protein CsbA
MNAFFFEISGSHILITSVVSVVLGIIILVAPRTLNYIVAFYFIVMGVVGLMSVFMEYVQL